MNDKIEELIGLPVISEALKKQKADAEASALQVRRNALRWLTEAVRDEIDSRAEYEQAQTWLRDARAAFEGAVADARKAEGKLNDALRRRHHFEAELRRNGEAKLEAAKIELRSRLQYLAGQRAVYQSIKPELAPGGLYTLPLKKEVQEMREKLCREVDDVSRALSDLDALTGAECSPGDLAARVEEVLSPFREEDNSRA